MSDRAADILRRARALVDTPEKWTKGADARDRRGRDLSSAVAKEQLRQRATCFCVNGALYAQPESWSEGLFEAYAAFSNAIGGEPWENELDEITEWNDMPERTHAEVMDAFDRAIALVEAAVPA